MYLTAATAIAALAAAGAVASRTTPIRRDDGDDPNFFPSFDRYQDWAICKGRVTKGRFPNLQAPTDDGGCVRYFQGIDITGVVTEKHFFAKDGFASACDCVAECLVRSGNCTNWVWKHAFMDGDDGKRSCTLYSSPNLPANVTLAYDTGRSTGFDLLQPTNNPQMGANVPLTFLDQQGTQPDTYGVSGFAVQDQSNRQYC